MFIHYLSLKHYQIFYEPRQIEEETSMEGFEVTKIGKHIFCILDAGNSSFYMIEGDEKAAVIDTGITTGKKIMPLLRELTDKPLLLVVTHVHWDHIYHMDEFEEVYMCHDEKKK